MLSAIKKFFTGLNPFQATKKEKPNLSDSKVLRTSQVLSTSAIAPPARKITAKPIKSEGWFSRFTNLFRRKLYEMFKGEPPSKPADIRQLLGNIGGEEYKLKTEHDVTVRTMHLKASGFLEKFKEAKGSKVEIKASGKTIPGFVFDEVSTDLKTTLSKLGLLDSRYTDSKGHVTQISGPWAMEVINGKTYILAKSDFEFLIQNDALTEKGFTGNVSFAMSPIATSQGNNTTVVLGGGIFSYFESYRSAQESAQFLIRGLDVVIFEDKNLPLESEADYHVMAAREVIFDHLKSTGLRNDQIILKGLCFSSVPAVELAAAKGGDVPVIIDQGYTDIKPVAANGVGNRTWAPLSNVARAIARPIINGTFSEFDIDYKMDHLEQIKAPLCVIVNENDELVPAEEKQKMEEKLKGRSFHRVAINNPNIRHAGPWYQDPSATKQIDNFLNQNFNNQQMIGVS